MSDWIDKFKLGKSAFIKRDLRLLPLTEPEFEVDFFLDRESSSKDQERWLGLVIEREFGAVLAMEDVQLPPPTVNDLATMLAHAMSRPLTGGDRQRPGMIHARDRPQWQELLPHLQQLGIEVVLADDLPWFDEVVEDQRLHDVLKYGLDVHHWNEFVFQAYHHHQYDAIFLAGLPDVKGSLPHA